MTTTPRDERAASMTSSSSEGVTSTAARSPARTLQELLNEIERVQADVQTRVSISKSGDATGPTAANNGRDLRDRLTHLQRQMETVRNDSTPPWPSTQFDQSKQRALETLSGLFKQLDSVDPQRQQTTGDASQSASADEDSDSEVHPPAKESTAGNERLLFAQRSQHDNGVMHSRPGKRVNLEIRDWQKDYYFQKQTALLQRKRMRTSAILLTVKTLAVTRVSMMTMIRRSMPREMASVQLRTQRNDRISMNHGEHQHRYNKSPVKIWLDGRKTPRHRRLTANTAYPPICLWTNAPDQSMGNSYRQVLSSRKGLAVAIIDHRDQNGKRDLRAHTRHEAFQPILPLMVPIKLRTQRQTSTSIVLKNSRSMSTSPALDFVQHTIIVLSKRMI